MERHNTREDLTRKAPRNDPCQILYVESEAATAQSKCRTAESSPAPEQLEQSGGRSRGPACPRGHGELAPAHGMSSRTPPQAPRPKELGHGPEACAYLCNSTKVHIRHLGQLNVASVGSGQNPSKEKNTERPTGCSVQLSGPCGCGEGAAQPQPDPNLCRSLAHLCTKGLGLKKTGHQGSGRPQGDGPDPSARTANEDAHLWAATSTVCSESFFLD